jgi:integron integrase
MAGRGSGTRQPGVVRVRLEGPLYVLRFLERYTSEDLGAVKAVPGRRWDGERRVWLLPQTPTTLTALKLVFGSRLVVTEPTRAIGHGLSSAADGGRLHTQRPAQDPLEAAVEDAEAAAEDVPVAETEDAEAAADDTPEAGAEDVSKREGTMVEVEEPGHLLDALRRAIRTRGYSPKTEKAYLGWVRRFLAFHRRGPEEAASFGATHAEAFLEHLAMVERLAARSRNQAAAALAFLFRAVLGRDELADVPRAKGPRRLPLVMSHTEVLRVLRQLVGKYFLIGVLMYSAGLRLEESLRLRVRDIDFELRQILIRNAKGQKDRYVPLAQRAQGLLRAQIRDVAERHERDRRRGHGWAPLPDALHRKKPLAGYELGSQFLFPASTIRTDPATGKSGRWSLHATAVQREITAAVRASGITKPATCHTFRHSFATEALRSGCDIRTLQHVMGHKDVRTTMIYLHVVEQTGHLIRSPLDRPDEPEPAGDSSVDRPWSDVDMHWDLAARQWVRRRPPRRESGAIQITRHAPSPRRAD